MTKNNNVYLIQSVGLEIQACKIHFGVGWLIHCDVGFYCRRAQPTLSKLGKFILGLAVQQSLQELLRFDGGDISSVARLDTQEAEAIKTSKSNAVKDLANSQGFQRHQSGEISEAELFQSLGVSNPKKRLF